MKTAWLLGVALWTAVACNGRVRDDTTRIADTTGAGGTAQAADQCVRGEPEPVLTATGSAGSARPRFERKGRLEAVEEVRLSDSTTLRITHGGCAHYVETYTFTVERAARDTTDVKYWLARAASYLRALPAVEVRRSQLDEMAAALQKAAAGAAPAYGDAIQASEMATIMPTVRRTGPNTVVIEIVYDVVL